MQSKREQLESELTRMISEKINELKQESGMDVSQINVNIQSCTYDSPKKIHYLASVDITYFSQPS